MRTAMKGSGHHHLDIIFITLPKIAEGYIKRQSYLGVDGKVLTREIPKNITQWVCSLDLNKYFPGTDKLFNNSDCTSLSVL